MAENPVPSICDKTSQKPIFGVPKSAMSGKEVGKVASVFKPMKDITNMDIAERKQKNVATKPS